MMMTPRNVATRALAPAALALVAAGATAVACAPDTGGKVVAARFALEGPAASERAFTTDLGWAVTLDEACVALGPVYVWELGGVLGRAAPASTSPRARLAVATRAVYDALVPSAAAHPGDGTFFGGEVKAEWLEQVAVDPTTPGPKALAPIRGTAGPVRSLTVHLEPPREALVREAACLRGHHAYVVGVARRGDVTVAFEGGLDVPAEGTMRRVDGVALDGELDDGATIVVRPDVRRWFVGADFATLPAPGSGGRAVVAKDTQVYAAWSLGARSLGAFHARLVPAAEAP